MARNTQYVYERAKDLLQKNIDGFIFLNNGPIVMNDETNNMLKLLYYDTRELNQNFTFKSCLFILSKSDIHPSDEKNEFPFTFEIYEKRKLSIN